MTPRETELTDALCQGLTNKQIGARLGLTEGTVKAMLHALYNKTGARNRTELALMTVKKQYEAPSSR